MATNEPLPEAQLLPDCPTDGITRLCYLSNNNNKGSNNRLLASTSWDGNVRVHDTTDKVLVLSHFMEAGALLSLDVHQNLLYVGGADGSIRRLDMETGKPQWIGAHESKNSKACSCLNVISEHVVASAGWHRQLHLWDVRQQSKISTVELPGKAFSMDVDTNKTLLAVATSGRRLVFIDVRKTSDLAFTADLVLDRESSLKYQTRCLRFFPDSNAIVIGSIEGRAAVEFLEDLGRPALGKKFAFKCHRVGDMVYPVNAIAFHPKYGTFATGGCDGTVGTYVESEWYFYGFCKASLTHSLFIQNTKTTTTTTTTTQSCGMV
jgi:cell cycle arrest protein BUB3